MIMKISRTKTKSAHKFIVTEKAQRPARMDGTCFYCMQPIGAEHKPDCVLIHKRVKVRATIEYETEIPNWWGNKEFEFHRNEGSWCANNMVGELKKYVEEKPGCLCGHAEFEYLGEESEPYLDER